MLVVLLGGLGHAPAESIVGTARWAATLDTIESALSTDAFEGAVLATDGETPGPDIPGIELDVDPNTFHFGRRLAGVLRGRNPAAAVYMGGGSLPLLLPDVFVSIAERLVRGITVTNNTYSSDLVAFPLTSVAHCPSPERILAAIEAVDRDNALARALSEGAGLTVEPLPRTIETQFDIDSPADLAILSLSGRGGPRLCVYLGALDLDLERYRRVLPIFLDPNKQLLVAGRVGSHAWAYLERETACRVRLFAEERGMEAEGRAEAGTARSLLGFHIESVGVGRFFETLAELGDAAVIDSRVLLAHKLARSSREDRFLSDLGRYREISDPFLRDLTRAAIEAPIPVLLGGHSLMSGGLMLLNEHAWAERDAGRL
jgi:hypothetical protein